jgi:two-component system NtrC family response regulator
MIKKLLIIEDDPGLQSQLRWCFSDFEVLLASDEASALSLFKSHSPQVVTLDLGLPPDPGGYSVGFEILQKILTLAPSTKIIVVTGQEDREHALNAIALGAYDFFNKPVDAKTLALVVDRAYHLFQIEQENKALLEKTFTSPLDGLIASSDSMLRVCKTVEKIAPSDLGVLILGESGTGKEVVARAVHNLSAHADGKYVAINCAAIPENLLESELFGHEKGSFTGASSQKIGKIELADNGTLFLDEIGDMPLDLQAKLLRFLQERVIERVGGTKEIAINTRVICATHCSIQDMIKQGTFREDLYFRISDIVLELPPLREREDDIVLLANFFLKKYTEQQNKNITGLSTSAENLLMDYECRGNVRELDQIIRRAVIMSDNTILQPDDLNITIDNKQEDNQDEDSTETLNLKIVRNIAERRAIRRALAEADNNISDAAKLLNITRPTLYSLIERLHIELT